MALERGRFGIEYNPRQMRNESSGLGWLIVAVVVVALLSLSWSLVKRFRSHEDPLAPEPPRIEQPAAMSETATNNTDAASVEAMPPAPPVIAKNAYSKRPAIVRNLLMRLEEAEKKRDIEMAVTTIETIRRLPGSPAADIDDSLARRLGTLNIRRLFIKRNAQWVKEITVKRGDSASRIAAENGSTLASFIKLNGGKVDKLVIGTKVYVMDHPRFNLVVHRRTRTADLSLNGKFFCRYDLSSVVKAKEGAYEMPEKKKLFWGRIGVWFKPGDQVEIETLLPVGAPVLVSEM